MALPVCPLPALPVYPGPGWYSLPVTTLTWQKQDIRGSHAGGVFSDEQTNGVSGSVHAPETPRS